MQSPAMPSPATIGGALESYVYHGEILPPEAALIYVDAQIASAIRSGRGIKVSLADMPAIKWVQ